MKLPLIAFAALLLSASAALFAAEPESEPDPFELTIEENLSLPKMGNKQRNAVHQRMQTVYSALQRRKYNVSKRHDGNIVTVSVPCALLFAANDTTALLPQAEALLKPLVEYAADTDLYKIVISVHSDNTGSEQYRDAVTEARANILCDFFEQQSEAVAQAQNVIPYGVGHDEPLGPDNSIAHRSRNRRVEFNIVPLR